MKQFILSLAIVFTLLTCIGSSGFAQVANKGLNADGKDFYVGWLYPSYNDQNLNLGTRDPKPFFGVYVLVSSYTDNQFNVSYFDEKTGKETNTQTFSVAKRRALIVPVDRAHMRMDKGGPNGFDGEVAQYRAMHITAKKPINVQFFSSGANSGGSYLALPVNVLGKEYVVEAYKDNASGAGGYLSSEDASGYFMIIAAFDGTTVQIVPNSTTKVQKQPGVNCGAGANGTPQGFIVPLQRGQCYMVKSTGTDSYCDISGSTVVADKPIVVLGGHENAFTDGSDVGTILVEQRDYMVEQMIPVEYWDSTGYVSVPMVDSKSAQGGDGDNLAFFYGKLTNAAPNYPKGSTVTLLPQSITYSIGPYPSAVPIKAGVTIATSASDNNGAKMHMVQYDQRMQGGAPYPAPSQMTIMPMSAWKSSYLWYVPSNVTPQEVYQGYYITLICDKTDYNNGTLQWAQDGGALVPIKSAGAVNGIKQIPGYPELIGMAIKLSAPRAYYATSTIKKPFMVYNYGFRAIDADRDLGDFCADDHFFGYALPVGFAASTGDSSFFTIKVDTLCAKWDLCASVSGTNSPKIKSITLLDDREEDLVDKPNSSTGYVSYNARFDPKDDPDGKGEINLQGTDSSKCVRLFVQNPLDSAYVAVLVVDDKGNYVVVELYYKASALADTIKGEDFNLLKSPWGLANTTIGYHKDSIMYPITGVGDSHCATIYYYNTGDSIKGTPPIVVTGTKLGGADGSFTMTTVPSPFPVTLHPAGRDSVLIDPLDPKKGKKLVIRAPDTLKVTVCFNSKDTLFHLDTMTLSTDCYDAPVALFGPGGTPLITATDYDFGPVVIGSSNCTGNTQYGPSKITVRNLGNLPFLLTEKWVINNILGGPEFSMDPVSAARLQPNGYTLWPTNDPAHPRQDSINLYFCYTPVDVGPDSSIVDWNTDIKAPFKDQIKSWSYLKGRGIKPGVIWDRPIDSQLTVCDTSVLKRVHLYSIATAKTRVDKVYFSGPDAGEYAVTANQTNQSPLEGFDMNPGDTIWVDYTFTPDINKPWPNQYARRHAVLEASFFVDAAHTIRDTTKIDIFGDVRYAAAKLTATKGDTVEFGIVPLQQERTGVASLHDTGTHRYTICDIKYGAPVLDILNPADNKKIQSGTVIDSDAVLALDIHAQLDLVGDTVVPIIITPCETCGNPITIWVHIAAAQTILTTTDGPALPTYIVCRQDKLKLRAKNASPGGSSALTNTWHLTDVSIISTPGNTDVSEFDLVDPLDGSSKQTIKPTGPTSILLPGMSYDIDVVYHPTKVGNVSATVRYTFDSLGLGTKIITRDNLLTGTGKAEKTTMTAANPNPVAGLPLGTYTDSTSYNITVPLSFTIDTLASSADVRRVTFDLLFSEDLFNIKSFTANTNLFDGATTRIVSDGVDATNPKLHRVKFEATPNNGPVSVGKIGDLSLQINDAVDLTSDFVIENMVYYDAAGNSICYIVTDTIPGTFIPLRRCGDATLIDFLKNGQIVMKIESLTPNPATQDKSPVLTYKLYQDNTPVRIEVYNLLGEKIATVDDQASVAVGTHKVQIPVSDLQSGTYNVMVTTPHSSRSQQFILKR